MFRRVGLTVSAGVAVMAMTAALSGQNGTYPPDWTFKGTALTGMQQVGQATWRVEKGEIVAMPTSADGGWLLLDKGYQDVQFSASYKCAGACTVGVMLRSEKTPEGMKGLYTVVSGDEHVVNGVVVDAQGKITSRTPVTRNASGQYRFPPAAPAPAAAGGGDAVGGRAGGRAGGGGAPGGGRAGAGAPGGGRGARGGGAPGAGGAAAAAPFTSMFPAPTPATFKPTDWNTFEVLADVDITGASVNGRGGRVAVDGNGGSFGPIALHVAGTGEVRFKDIALKDLNLRVNPKETTASRFRAQRFEDFYYGWSAAAADFNHDGQLDVTVANRYYLAPDFTESREIYAAQPYNPAKEYGPAMVNFAFDYTGDGWDDVLVVESRPPVLYVNPKGESRRWTRHVIVPQGVTVATESIEFKDVNADGKPDAIFAGGGLVHWLSVDPANPTGPWKATAVSEPGPAGSSIHGIGAGDISGDGKVDIIAPHGWWEQPASNPMQGPWKFHQGAFGRNGNAGGNFGVYDINGDKVPDVITALAAHGLGLVWYEQKKGAAGAESTWVEHQITGDFNAKNPGGITFSELHALTMADIDGDGIQDIITGKRHWAHEESYTDPDPMGPALLVWYRTVRNPKAPGGAEFTAEVIHNRSGVGSMIQTADLNKDGAIDIISGTNRGGFIFWNTPRAGARRGAAAPAAK